MTPEELTLMGVLVAALLGSIFGPVIIEYIKLVIEPKRTERHENEVRYSHLLTNLTGFIGKADDKKIEEFYEHYRQAWLYAPDAVIKSINRFLISVEGAQLTPTAADKASRNMILEIRKAFKGKTELKPEDFLIIVVPST